MSRRIEIVDVSPRDGLQNEGVALSVDERLEFIGRLEAAGVRRLEAVSFVNPKRVPQMAGAEEIMAALPHQAGRSRIGLVLNLRGWERLKGTSCDEANVVVCATDSFGLRNQNADTAQQIAVMAEIAADQAANGGPPLSLIISVAFGCPFEGEVPLDRVAMIAREAAALGIPEIAIADTIGAADPWAVGRRVEAVRAAALQHVDQILGGDVAGGGRGEGAAADAAAAGVDHVHAGVDAGGGVGQGGVAGVVEVQPQTCVRRGFADRPDPFAHRPGIGGPDGVGDGDLGDAQGGGLRGGGAEFGEPSGAG